MNQFQWMRYKKIMKKIKYIILVLGLVGITWGQFPTPDMQNLVKRASDNVCTQVVSFTNTLNTFYGTLYSEGNIYGGGVNFNEWSITTNNQNNIIISNNDISFFEISTNGVIKSPTSTDTSNTNNIVTFGTIDSLYGKLDASNITNAVSWRVALELGSASTNPTSTFVQSSEVGQANGVCELDSNGFIPIGRIAEINVIFSGSQIE